MKATLFVRLSCHGFYAQGKGDYQQAIDMLNEVRCWEHANHVIEIAKWLMRRGRIVGMMKIIFGSKIEFGLYPQNDDTPSPITWLVLAKEDNSL